MRGAVRALAAVCAMWALIGCSTLSHRAFELNTTLDTRIVGPVTEHYVKTVPEPVRTSFSNARDNAGYLGVALNQLLQGKPKTAARDVARFVVNSTIGLAGLLDPAKDMGLEKNEEDFGQTLAVWGFAEGRYFVLPFLGPTTFRDAWRHPYNLVTNALFWIDPPLAFDIPYTLMTGIDTRMRNSKNIELAMASADPYAFIREAYLQNRLFLIHDGNPPDTAEKLEEGVEGLDLEGLEGLEDLEGLDEMDLPDDADLEGLDDLEGGDDLDPVGDAATVPDRAPLPPPVIRAAPAGAPPSGEPSPSPAAPPDAIGARGPLPPPVVRRAGKRQR